MRICVVGCGAVGSLFAANLATLDDVEVWVFDLNKPHIDAIKKNGLQLVGAGDVLGHPNATSDPAELPACDFGIVATKAMHADAAIAATAHAFADGAVATVMNGVGNEETLAATRRESDPGHDVPGRQAPRAGSRAVGRQGRHDVRPVRAASDRDRGDRAARRRVHAGPGCRPRRSRTRVQGNGGR